MRGLLFLHSTTHRTSDLYSGRCKFLLYLLFSFLCSSEIHAQKIEDIDEVLDRIDTTDISLEQLQLLVDIGSDWMCVRTLADYDEFMHDLIMAFEDIEDPDTRELLNKAKVRQKVGEGLRLFREIRNQEGAASLLRAQKLARMYSDTNGLVMYGRVMSDMLANMGDEISAVRVGRHAYQLALEQGDSSNGIIGLMDLVSLIRDTIEVQDIMRLGEDYFTPENRDWGHYLWTVGWVNVYHNHYEEALGFLLKAESYFELNGGSKELIRKRVLNYWTTGEAYRYLGDYRNSISALEKGLSLSINEGDMSYRDGLSAELAGSYIAVGVYDSAEVLIDWVLENSSFYEYRLAAFNSWKELLFSTGRLLEYVEVDKLLSEMIRKYDSADVSDEILAVDFALQLQADSLQYASQIAARETELSRQRFQRNAFLALGLALSVFGSVLFRQRRRLNRSLKRSDELLLNILPAEVATELKVKGSSETKLHQDVTVLFTDFRNFTELSKQYSPRELIQHLNFCFSAFDRICSQYGLEKIKTIGDAYMTAGGLPVASETHAVDVVTAALDIRDYMEADKKRKQKLDLPYFEIRIGIHSGPVVAGIVGRRKFQYDIWGETVNTAASMEKTCEVGRVNISRSTFDRIQGQPFIFTARGEMEIKGKASIEMWYVDRA